MEIMLSFHLTICYPAQPALEATKGGSLARIVYEVVGGSCAGIFLEGCDEKWVGFSSWNLGRKISTECVFLSSQHCAWT